MVEASTWNANGRLRRHPLSVDKRAAQAMLNEIVRKVDWEKAGVWWIARTTNGNGRSRHTWTSTSLTCGNKGVTELQQKICTGNIRKIMESCKWKLIQDITVASALAFLGDLRPRDAARRHTFTSSSRSSHSHARLVRDRRTHVDPVAYVRD